MADTAALVVALSAQLTKFEKDMREAVQIADKGTQRIQDKFDRINPNFDGVKKALHFLIAGEALSKLKELIQGIDDLGDQAEIVGLTTDAFQKLQFAIIASGQSAEAANTFMERFSRGLSDAQAGAGELGKIFAANKIDVQNLDVETALGKFADLIKNAKNSQDQLNLAMTVGGRQAGPALVQALKGGSAGLKELGEEAERTGNVLSSEKIKEGQKIFAEYQKLVNALTKSFQQLALVVAGSVKGAFENLPRFPTAGEQQPIEEFLFGKGGMKGFLDRTDIFKNQLQGKGGISIRPGGSTEPNLPGAGDTVIPKTKDAIDRQIESINRHTAAVNASVAAVGESVGVQERLRVEAELTQTILENDKSPEAYAAQIAKIGAAAEEAADRLARRKFQFEELTSASRELGSALSEAFQGAIIDGKKFDEVLSNLVRRLESKAFDKLFDLAFAPQGAATNSVFGQLLASLIPKQAGGPVSAGQGYLVGERGPEMFVPGRSGMIIPNKVTAKGAEAGDRNLNVSVDVTGANGDAAIEAAVNRGVARAVKQSVAIVNSTSPARSLRYSQLGT